MKLSCTTIALSGCLAVTVSLPVAAQQDSPGLQLQHFRPATNGQGGLGVEGPDLLAPMAPFVGVVFDFGSALLMKQYTDPDSGETVRDSVVDYQFLTHVSAGIGILPWMDFGLVLPVAVLQQGDWNAEGNAIPAQALGDTFLVPRFRILNSAANNALPLSLTVVLPVSLPTGDGQAFMGEQGPTVTPQLVAGRRYEKLAWSAAIGYRVRKSGQYVYGEFKPIELRNELEGGAALRYEAFNDLEAVVEVQGSTAFIQDEVYDEPIEARIGIGMHASQGLSATVGLGFGLTGGYGAPLWRGLAAISYAFGPVEIGPRDADEDGIADTDDACPNEPEDQDGFQDQDGCPDPDNDGDQIADTDDSCANDPEDMDGFEDQDGCPDPDNDQDGILDDIDKCPLEPEDLDQFEDQDGCPDLDHDQDGIPDDADKCPAEPESMNGYQDDDGCPEPDRDGDGIPDALDKCPKLPEWKNGYKDDDGCPEKDRDKDGIPDGIDKCPRAKETVNGYKDEDGCPERDRDKDGIVDALDKCPKLKEPRNGVLDEYGCPDADMDNDGIPDVLDRCRKKPETFNGFQDEDGCPDSPPSK